MVSLNKAQAKPEELRVTKNWADAPEFVPVSQVYFVHYQPARGFFCLIDLSIQRGWKTSSVRYSGMLSVWFSRNRNAKSIKQTVNLVPRASVVERQLEGPGKD